MRVCENVHMSENAFLSVRLPAELRNRLKAVAARRGVSLQRLMHDALEALLRREEAEPPKLAEVVAKGQDFLALRIRQIAQQHGIPLIQRPPLARGLFAAVEVGEQIPPMFYRAVAEVLAYVYRLSGRAAG